MPKPFGDRYPHNPQSVGEHIRKKRMELRLFQKDVASILEVTTDCVTLWENNKAVPQIHHVPQIIQFLGFNPYVVSNETLGGKIKNYRMSHGLTHKKLGDMISVDASTVSCWESGTPPNSENLSAIKGVLEKISEKVVLK